MTCKRCARLKMVCFADRWSEDTDRFRSHESYPVPTIDMSRYGLASAKQDRIRRMCR